MENIQQTIKEYFKIISIFHFALAFGLIVFGLVISFLLADFQHPDNESDFAKILVYLVPGLLIVGIVASIMVFSNRLDILKGEMDFRLKMEKYREALIIRYALLEGPGLFALVSIFLTNNSEYLLYAAAMLILLLIKRPSIKSAIKELELDQNEISKIENPDFVI